jgi:hypothetical protein
MTPPNWPLREVHGFLTGSRERGSSGSGDAGAEMTGANSTSPRRMLRRTGWPRVVADPRLPQTRTCSH